MLGFMADLSPIVQALLATLFTWGMTAMGASAVFFTREVSRRLLDSMLGFAAGVMIAASFWSLLAPAIDMSADMPLPSFFPATIGFLGGGFFLWCVDRVLPHLHLGSTLEEAEGMQTPLKQSVLLVLAITLHNIPEGLAVGVAFGALSSGHPASSLSAALALAFGIGIQNFPEGIAVALPLRGEGMSRVKSFWYGQLSAVVEPVSAVIGAALVILMQPLLPYALGFAAGAMLFVVVEELIPTSQRGGHTDLATLGAMLGFAAMMVLDVAMG